MEQLIISVSVKVFQNSWGVLLKAKDTFHLQYYVDVPQFNSQCNSCIIIFWQYYIGCQNKEMLYDFIHISLEILFLFR